MSHRERLAFPLAALLSFAACGDGGGETPDAGNNPNVDAPPGATAVLKRPSKSSTVAISNDDSLVAMVNPDNNSLSIFRTSDDTRTAIVPTGKEPSSVAIAPDGKTAFVSNRADATVVRITGIDTDNPTVATTVSVGSEPAGVALSPTGARLYVAEYAEGRITVLDTTTLQEIGSIKGNIQHPHAVAVTNDNDADDDDELVLVPEFFGEANVTPTNRENIEDLTKLDQSRVGRVRIYDSATLSAQSAILFQPRSSGITPTGTTAGPVFTSANQLWSVGIRRDASGAAKIYVPSVSASPQPPARFDGNVYPVVWVGDLQSRTEDNGTAGTVNLAQSVLASRLIGDTAGTSVGKMDNKLFLTEIVDIDFLPVSGGRSETNVAYVVSRGADAMQRVTFDNTEGPILGVPGVSLQVDLIGDATSALAGCKAPTGIVLRSDGAKAYVNCWVSHKLGVVLLGNAQRLDKTVDAFDNDPANLQVDKGRRFFSTGRGRWSGNSINIVDPPTLNGLAWGSCTACHPDGLSDNITWIFGTGPRQTTSLDGSFSKHGAVRKQRALNWTAIFDEFHDFEKNTRDTSGGLGAITQPTSGNAADCGKVALETRKPIVPGVGAPVREVQNTAGNCQRDWDDINVYVQTIRPPKGLKRIDQAKVALGKEVFGQGASGTENNRAGCVQCHGGPGFTVSHVFWDQNAANNAALADPTVGALVILSNIVKNLNNQTIHLQAELTGNPASPTVAPLHVTCGLRNIGTFGPAALEKRDNATLSLAQGSFSGFNVPSLYGMSLGAPYLHDGLALTLDDLLKLDGPYSQHLKAGNPNFNPSADELEALKLYVLSIDADSDELTVPSDGANPFDICPASFVAP